jgi:protein TonB
VGGAVVAPALLHRVEPVYPRAAVAARVEGVVVLEAIVDVEGRVQEVKVLRPVSLLNEAAVEALKQWRYAPLTIKGVASPWVLVVTLTFKLQARP